MEAIRSYPTKASLFVLTVSAFVLIGSYFSSYFSSNFGIESIYIDRLTTLCFLMSALSLLFHTITPFNRSLFFRSASMVSACVVMALAIKSFYSVFYSINAAAGVLPALMPLNFIFLAIALLFEDPRNSREGIVHRLFGIFVLFFSFPCTVVNYINFTGMAHSQRFSYPTLVPAALFLALALGVILLHPDRGYIKTFTAPTHTSKLMRWMFFSVTIATLILRWLTKAGYENGLYSREVFDVTHSMGSSLPIVVVIILAGQRLVRSETDLLRQHSDLQESQEQFKALVDISAQIVWFAEPDGTLIDEVESWKKFTGQTYDERKGRGWLNVVHPDDREQAWASWSEATQNLSEYSVEYRVLHVSGEWRWMWARGKPLFNTRNTVRAWVGMNSDIHEEKKTAIALQEAKDQAERSNYLKSSFLANMSHEIRTPLGAILGFSELLSKGNLSAEAMAKYVGTIRRNGELLETIISDILDLSKVEAGQLVIEYLPVRTADILKDMFDMLQAKAFRKNLDFSFESTESTPPLLTTDPMRLKQILINIIGNALKFTAKGKVSLTTRAWRHENKVKGVIFSVSDTGIGIARNQWESIFEIFVQADNSTTRLFGGTGLGLSLSRKLALQLGGNIVIAESTLGRGTTFDICIEDRPQCAQKQAGELDKNKVGTALTSPNLHKDGMRVLIVDDAEDNQMLMTLLLQEINATVECADNGLIACQKVSEKPFDLVLMDLQMPVMDGYAATRKLREDGFDLPIIAVTAHAMSDVKEKCIAVGFSDYLPKPINFLDLVAAIARCTEK